MSEVELRDAATVLILRDGPRDADGDALEVFMLRRNLDSDFVGGAFVFPGGAVDPEDRHDDLDTVCRGRSDADASARLGIEQGGLAFWVAAIRESFEEAGVLLAYHPDGDVIRLADPETNERFAAHRAAVDGGQRRLVEICARRSSSSWQWTRSGTSATGSPPWAHPAATTRGSSSRSRRRLRPRSTTTTR